MALSGSTNFNMTAGEIVSSALKQCGIGLNSEVPKAHEINDAMEDLNIIIKAWSKKGLKLWAMGNQSIPLVADKLTYTLGPTGDIVMDRPLELQSAYRSDTDDNDTQMTIFSREEYRMLSNKSSEGAPLQIYYDAQLDNAVMNIWPVPNATDAAEFTIELSWRKPIDDADVTTDDLEFPSEWYRALKWNLTQEIMVAYDLPENRQRRISKLARDSLKDAEASDSSQNTSVFFQPNKRG